MAQAIVPVALAALVASGACATYAPPARTTGTVEGVDSILWSAERRVTWKDFLATPDRASEASAMTAYVISATADCRADGAFHVDVVSAFIPERSWVRVAVLANPEASRAALRHEQTHFDLAEVQTRKIRWALSALVDPCAKTKAEVDAVIDPFMQEDLATQARYDRDTRSGTDARRQDEWDEAAARELRALAAWARPRAGRPLPGR
jgi:hypothetical protein